MLAESAEPTAPDVPECQNPFGGGRPAAGASPRYWAWAPLMQRAFDVDVLACPRCRGRLRLVATVDDPHVIHEILAPHPDPPQPPPGEAGGLLADVLS